MKMLIFIAFMALILTVYADYPREAEEELNIIVSKCRGKFKITDEEYTKLRYDKLPQPNEHMQCLINCLLETAGMIKDGIIQPDGTTKLLMIKKVDEEKAQQILERCRDESGASNCETAYKLHKCFIKNKAY